MNAQLKLLLYICLVVGILYYVQQRYNLFEISFENKESKQEEVEEKLQRVEIINEEGRSIFVEVEEGIEGLVHVSEISKEKVNTPVGLYNVGDVLETKVISVSAKDRKIGLSIKAMSEDSGEMKLDEYKKQQASSAPSTLGDLLKEELVNQEKQADA